MRKTISTALTAALFAPVVLFAACVSGGTIEPGEEVEDTLTSTLPLSAACGECAADALGTTCASALDACVNTPDCLDVSGCMEACSPNDASCFAGCAQASAVFGDLVECALCNECETECANDWTCEGDPSDPNDPPEPQDPGECGQCLLEQASDECQDLAQACLGSAECFEVAQCVVDCGLNDACVQQYAANTNDETAILLYGLFECATTSPCAEACVEGQDNQPDPPDGDPNAECVQCAQEAALQECPEESTQCLQTEGCQEAIECWTQCSSDAGCAEQCAANVSDEAVVAAQAVVTCAMCGACPQQCGDVCQ